MVSLAMQLHACGSFAVLVVEEHATLVRHMLAMLVTVLWAGCVVNMLMCRWWVGGGTRGSPLVLSPCLGCTCCSVRSVLISSNNGSCKQPSAIIAILKRPNDWGVCDDCI